MSDLETFAAAPPDLRELLALASDLALEAGRIHAEGRRRALTLETKSSPTDVVSQVDREAEQLIMRRLSTERPRDALLAEEGSLLTGESGVRWIVDPLDGTTNYVYGYPAYAASIAVEVDGIVTVGAVLDSASGRLYRAIAGHGAVCGERRLRARRSADLSTALVATGFSYDAAQRERQGAVVAAALGRIRDIRRGGTAALDLCRVAAGEVDAYWELDLSPWDYAAGTLIAREAGAAVEHLQASHGRGPAVVAAHPALMPAFLALLEEAGALRHS
ncbi:MAG: inositol monophosphatase [Actinobacteria bacterium]|nr:inositol monophosphatase [Actinomycetota bacterium]